MAWEGLRGQLTLPGRSPVDQGWRQPADLYRLTPVACRRPAIISSSSPFHRATSRWPTGGPRLSASQSLHAFYVTVLQPVVVISYKKCRPSPISAPQLFGDNAGNKGPRPGRTGGNMNSLEQGEPMVCCRRVTCSGCGHTAVVQRVGLSPCWGAPLLRYHCPNCGIAVKYLCEAEEKVTQLDSPSAAIPAYIV